MHTIYSFVYGPLAWTAFLLFVGGCLFRLVQMLRLINKTEKFIWTYMSWKYSLRSLLHWLTPFAATNWRKQPLLTVVTFVFHICLLVTPIFLLSHIVLWDESWNLRWWALPDGPGRYHDRSGYHRRGLFSDTAVDPARSPICY
jgi:hypothetical protein